MKMKIMATTTLDIRLRGTTWLAGKNFLLEHRETDSKKRGIILALNGILGEDNKTRKPSRLHQGHHKQHEEQPQQRGRPPKPLRGASVDTISTSKSPFSRGFSAPDAGTDLEAVEDVSDLTTMASTLTSSEAARGRDQEVDGGQEGQLEPLKVKETEVTFPL